MRTSSFIALLLLGAPVAGLAQVNLPRESGSGFALEWTHPYLEDTENPVDNMALFGSGHVRLAPTLNLLIEVPLATAKASEWDGGGVVFGNPYVGVQSHTASRTVDVGVRVPALTVDRYASVIGLVADLDRVDAFATDCFTIHFAVAGHSLPAKGITYGARFAPTFWIPTRKEEDSETEVTLGYAANVGVVSPLTRVNLRLSGMALLTETGKSFSDWTMNQIALTGDFGRGNIRPGIFVAKQLDSDAVNDVSVGLTLQFLTGRQVSAVAGNR